MNIQDHMAQQIIQPIRVKELLHYCESDDDESEDKPQDYDTESDSDEPQPLPQDDYIENDLNKSCPLPIVDSKTTCESVQKRNASSKLIESVSNNIIEYKASSIVPEACVSIHGNHNEGEEYDIKCKSSIQNNRAVCSSTKCEVPVPQQSVFHSNEQNIKCEHAVNSEPSNHSQLYCDSIHKQTTTVRTKRQSCEEKVYKNDFQSIDTFGSHNFGNGSQPVIFNLQSTSNKIELLESKSIMNDDKTHCESVPSTNRSLTSDSGILINAIDSLALQTPLKHPVASSVRPDPCYSRKNINQTPQSKLLSDISRSTGLTPATITPHWSQNTVKQTPLRSDNINYKDSLQISKNPIYFTPSTSKQETPRYSGTNGKERRPLADTKGFAHNDVSNRRLFQGFQLSKINEVTPKVQSKLFNETVDNKSSVSKQILKPSEIAHSEVDANKQSEENVLPNVENISTDKEAIVQNKVSDNKHATHSNKDSRETSKPSRNESQNQYSLASNQNQQQDIKKVADNASNVQFSMPSNISKLKPSKTVSVKGKEYLVLGTLGQGMSGEVLRAQDLSTLELCAIKCVNLNRMDKDSAQGCLEEISMLHKLQAPCIVKMFDYEIKYPMVYVVMEMGDTDLSHLLKTMSRDKQIPLTMILYYWTEMLTAVKHIHDNGVIHSDLKPANFLLVRGRLKLIDFGIASSMNADMTSVVKNCPIGTLNYISPEALMDIGGNSDSPSQNVKYKITFKSDVWSLGCILYSLVYGHTPFHHIRSQWAKVNAITNPKPKISFPTTLPSASGDKVESSPPILIEVMRKCLQHDPKARPTVAELLRVRYIPTKQERVPVSVPDIPANILVKIKHTLSEDEWRQLIRILEDRRNM